jgi:hypothetical protein
VVFVREIVPRWAIATAARVIYNEQYAAMPMRHLIHPLDDGRRQVEYGWKHRGRWCAIRATTRGEPQPLAAGSEAEFITEHYWGYAPQRGGGTVEYRVEHPSWRVWNAETHALDVDAATLYGPAFGASLAAPPRSAFVAEGSPIVVRRGVRV